MPCSWKVLKEVAGLQWGKVEDASKGPGSQAQELPASPRIPKLQMCQGSERTIGSQGDMPQDSGHNQYRSMNSNKN